MKRDISIHIYAKLPHMGPEITMLKVNYVAFRNMATMLAIVQRKLR